LPNRPNAISTSLYVKERTTCPVIWILGEKLVAMLTELVTDAAASDVAELIKA